MCKRTERNGPRNSAWLTPFRRFRKHDDGATAVEFALIAMPFMAMMFGIITIGLYFFITFTLESAVERASRLIRTGQAQTQEPPMTVEQFKQEVCDLAPPFADCAGKIRVNVTEFPGGFGAITPPSCTNSSGNLVPNPPPGDTVPGAAGTVVLVTVCYEWELAQNMPYLELGKMGNGSALIRASTTFRTEPYQ